jgi:NADPH-dependent ferric siderophore reductase
VRIFEQEQDMRRHPVVREPIKIAETEGEQTIEVYQGDFRRLHTVLPLDPPPITVLDLFDKSNTPALNRILDDWKKDVGGEVFIP